MQQENQPVLKMKRRINIINIIDLLCQNDFFDVATVSILFTCKTFYFDNDIWKYIVNKPFFKNNDSILLLFCKNMGRRGISYTSFFDKRFNFLLNLSNVNYTSKYGNTALTYASQNGVIPIVNGLISKGANINHTKQYETSPLILATEKNYIGIVEELIKAGCNVNHKKTYNYTAFMLACKFGFIQIVRILIDAGVDINAKSSSGYTGFLYACEEGHLEIFDILINKGINLEYSDSNGNTAVVLACKKEKIEIVKRLINVKVNLDIMSTFVIPPIIQACQNGNLELLDLLLNSGANININTSVYNSCNNGLIYASIRGHLNIVKKLIQKNININYVNIYNHSSLYYAKEHNNIKIVKLLTKYIMVN